MQRFVFWHARLIRRLDYTIVAVCFRTRDSEEELAMRLLLFVFWDARLRRRLDCVTVVVCYGTRDSKEDWTVRLLFFLWGTRVS